MDSLQTVAEERPESRDGGLEAVRRYWRRGPVRRTAAAGRSRRCRFEARQARRHCFGRVAREMIANVRACVGSVMTITWGRTLTSASIIGPPVVSIVRSGSHQYVARPPLIS